MKILALKTTLFSLLLTLSVDLWAQQPLSLAGDWRVRLDADTLSSANIRLPGTLDQAEIGTPTTGARYGILSRKHEYIGPAWYTREILIPKNWREQEVVLHLERVMWQSQVWIDGRFAGSQDGLGTPHNHSLGRLSPGRHQLTVRVNNDMIHNIGDKGHTYGEYTQIIWNGLIGKIELRPLGTLSLTNTQLYPSAAGRRLRVAFDIRNRTGEARDRKIDLHYTVRENTSGRVVKSHSERVVVCDTVVPHRAEITLDSIKPWDDRNPNLYTLEIALNKAPQTTHTFGFRDLAVAKSKILLNGRPIYIRGNLDCVHFPLTGYPSCEVADWERIFRIYKDHGLNQVRFHSWCPPRAAFEAADRLGILIQAEVVWIDWWMSTVNPDRPEMTTRGLPHGLGHNPSADAFVQAELKRMVEAYGNHPSFAMLCVGNELGNSDFDVMQSWIDTLKSADPRRLYSVSTARKITPADQFMVTHNIPGVGATYGLAEGRGTDFDLEKHYSQATIPIIAHELGQFPVHPLWNEIDKYRGVLEARNLQQLKDLAASNGLAKMDTAFHRASGALQTILYKSLLENLARTPSCAGFSFLSMTDYSGQGEALVGWLDSFWESKQIVEPEDFRGYSNDVMLLARFPKYVWRAGERFTAKIQTANYGPSDMAEPVRWSLTDTAGGLVKGGLLAGTATGGELKEIGEIAVDLPAVSKAQRLVLTVSYAESGYRNRWSIWVFPPSTADPREVMIADRFDERVARALDQGGSVLLMAHRLGAEEATTPLHFTPLFWSNSFFPGQSNKTLGLYIRSGHPALAGFPTDSHPDWQWQTLCRGRAFNLNHHPEIDPIVQPISDFHVADRLGSVFECRAGRGGKILVCGHDISGSSIEAEALKNSLLSYMNSAAFNPRNEMGVDEMTELFYSLPAAETVLPQGFEGAALYVKCGGNAPEGSLQWTKNLDKVLVSQKGCGYSVSCDDTWRDAHGAAWTGREITVEIATPNGIIGELYVRLEDWNGQRRRGVISVEGRESRVEAIDSGGQWVKLFVMREDTNDGKITLRARATGGGNLMISEIALVKQ